MFTWRAYKQWSRDSAEREARLTDVLDRLDATLERSRIAFVDLRDEVRANTQAILRLLDRLDGGAEPA